VDPVVPWSSHLSIDDVVEVLRVHPRVMGIALLGSTGTDRSTPTSDVDLLLLVRDLGRDVAFETTLVQGRLADVVLVDARFACDLGPDAAVPNGTWPHLAWLATARPLHDPGGLLIRAGTAATAMLEDRPVADPAAHQVIRAYLSHDVRVNAALLARREDAVLAAALGMRQLHTFVAGVQAWASLRGLPSAGWKRDLERLRRQDPPAFAVVEAFLAADDLADRHQHFVDLLDRALAPAGGLLPPDRVGAAASRTWTTLAPDPAA
jgi:predicted nucleotidyltransferase